MGVWEEKWWLVGEVLKFSGFELFGKSFVSSLFIASCFKLSG